MNVLEEIKDQLIGLLDSSIIGVIIGIVSILLALILHIRSRIRRQLSWSVQSLHHLASRPNLDAIQFIYEGKEVNSLWVTQLVLRNSGNRDIEFTSPIIIKCNQTVLSTIAFEEAFDFDVEPANSNEIHVSTDLLKNNESILIDVFTENPVRFNLSENRIRDVKLRNQSSFYFKSLLENGLMLITAILGFIKIIGDKYRAVLDGYPSHNLDFLIIYSVMGTIMILMFFNWARTSYKKSIKYNRISNRLEKKPK